MVVHFFSVFSGFCKLQCDFFGYPFAFIWLFCLALVVLALAAGLCHVDNFPQFFQGFWHLQAVMG